MPYSSPSPNRLIPSVAMGKRFREFEAEGALGALSALARVRRRLGREVPGRSKAPNPLPATWQTVVREPIDDSRILAVSVRVHVEPDGTVTIELRGMRIWPAGGYLL